MGDHNWEHNHGQFVGLSGLLTYSAERLPNSKGTACMARILELLTKTSIVRDGGRCWLVQKPLAAGQEATEIADTGVSEGVGAVIGSLALVLGAAGPITEARSLLDSAVGWLLSHRLPAECQDFFPAGVVDGRLIQAEQMSWCYGDLGLGAVLMVSAENTVRRDMKELARQVMVRVAGRSDESYHVPDACLCHGSAGSALVFARAHVLTGSEELFDAVGMWAARTIALGRREGAAGGYEFILHQGVQGSHSLLRGASGVGLALLALVTGIEPTWDRVLLLSSKHTIVARQAEPTRRG